MRGGGLSLKCPKCGEEIEAYPKVDNWLYRYHRYLDREGFDYTGKGSM